MAQTTGGMSFRAAVVDLSGDVGVTWTAISGHGAGVATAGGDRATGEQHTFEGDTPIVASGKRASVDVTVNYVYTETALEPFEAARTIYETAGAACHVRWFPKGIDDGNFVFTVAGIMTAFKYPDGEPGDGTVVLGSFTIKGAYVTKDDAAGGS